MSGIKQLLIVLS